MSNTPTASTARAALFVAGCRTRRGRDASADDHPSRFARRRTRAPFALARGEDGVPAADVSEALAATRKLKTCRSFASLPPSRRLITCHEAGGRAPRSRARRPVCSRGLRQGSGAKRGSACRLGARVAASRGPRSAAWVRGWAGAGNERGPP
eukprot:7284242-Prymnesium_polylepis.1